MKAITLTQPMATLIAVGALQIDTRSWWTHYRGPIAIHAAARLAPVGGRKGLHSLCNSEPFSTVLTAYNIHFATVLNGEIPFPLGAIVATAELVDIKLTEEVRESLCPQELALGDYSPGRYAWFLQKIVALDEPIPTVGGLKLWEWDRQNAEQYC